MMNSAAHLRLPKRVLVAGSGENAREMAATLGRLPGVGQVVQTGKVQFPLMGFDAVVEMVGGVTPAFDVAMGALSQGVACFTTNPLLLAAHGRVLQAAALGQNTTFGWQGACMATPVKDLIQSQTVSRIMLAFANTPNQLMVRMGFRQENAVQAKAQLRLMGADFSDMEGKHTASRMLGVAAFAWPTWFRLADITRQTVNDVDLADMKLMRTYGLHMVFGATVSMVKGTPVPYVGPMAVPHGHPMAAAHGDTDVLMVQDELTGQDTILNMPSSTSSIAGVVADMRTWFVRNAAMATQPLRSDEGWSNRAEDSYLIYARGPYALRALLGEDMGMTLLQDRVDADGIWTGVVSSTSPFTPLNLPAESFCVPLMGEWAPEQAAGLRLVA
jgi:homoserine dehydrogenase